MESSGGGNHQQPGAQNEPFFDLLQQSAPITAPTAGFSNSAYNIPKKMENSADLNFGGDEVLPSFDFQPIRTSGTSSVSNMSGGSSSSAARIEEGRGRQGSPPSSYTSYEPMVRRSREPPPTYETPISRAQEHEKESFDSATAAAVERTMKKYADNLLRVLEGMTGRLSHLELTTQRLEHLFEEIKNVVADTHGEADGKLRSLETHILEVHRGVQVLRDRQEIFEAQSQLAKLQMTTKGESATLHSTPSAPPPPPPPPPVIEPPSQLAGKGHMEAPQQQVPDASSSSYYQPQPHLQLQQMPSLPAPIPQQPQPPTQQSQQQQQQPPPQQQHLHHQLEQQQRLQQQQLQQQMQLQHPGVLQNEVSHQILQQQQPPPPPPPPQQLSHPSQRPPQPPHPPPAYPQQQQPSYAQQQQPAPQPPSLPNYGHSPEAPPYNQGPHPGSHHVPLAPPSYPADLPSYHPSYGPPRPGLPPPQQQPSQMAPSQLPQQPHNVGMYDSPMGRSGSGQLSLPAPPPPPPYLPQGVPQYEGQGLNPGGGYPGSSYRVAQPVPSAPSGGTGGYPRLPHAQPVPHAVPTSGGGGGAPSSGAPPSSKRVPIEEVIDNVTAMGFSKDQVRAVVRRLTENGQSVELNIVLDKLMNGDSSQAPPKGWFGR